jgi:SagB-type dehydrogenase family enzyme
MKPYQQGIGYRYLLETKYFLNRPLVNDLGIIIPAATYKRYPHASQIALPTPDFPFYDLGKAIAYRRSHRNYLSEPLDLKTLAHLLWATQGMTTRKGYRAAPSAGALYPIETYLSIQQLTDLPLGIYHFNVANFSLEQLAQGNFLDTLTSAALGQSSVKKAAIVFIWTAVILRSMAKYRDRAIRYIFLDAGHICQNLLLAATALGLGACPIGAFFDEEIDKIIGVNGDEEMTIYLATVGKI